MKTYLFVCTGNTCRSPMCAAYLNALNRDDICAFSAGIYTDGSPISPNAAAALKEAGIESTDKNPYLLHRSHTVCENDINKATLVFGVTSRHVLALRQHFPYAADKILPMPLSIADPYGLDIEAYTRCLSDITSSIKTLLSSLPEGETHEH